MSPTAASIAPIQQAAPRAPATAVIGIDGQEGGQDAVALARELVGPGGTLVLTAVAVCRQVTTRLVEADPEPAKLARASRDLVDVRRSLEGRTGPLGTVRADVRYAPSAAAGLHRAAREHAADVIVVGSSRRGLLTRVLADTDVRTTLDGSPCAVAVAARDEAEKPGALQHIGAGWNATPRADAALAVARVLAAARGLEARVLDVAESPRWASHRTGFAGVRAASARKAARRRLNPLGDVAWEVRAGKPLDELRRLAADLDLLVVGSRGDRRGGSHPGRTICALADDLGGLGCSLLVVLELDPHSPRD